MPARSLAVVLRRARHALGMTLRDVERATGIRNGHLSQIESGTIAKPELALLWELAAAYRLDYHELLGLAGYAGAPDSPSEQRARISATLHALNQLTAEEHAQALQFIADLQHRRRSISR
jgi:transcriptional regulator with XRE-family HTH domain